VSIFADDAFFFGQKIPIYRLATAPELTPPSSRNPEVTANILGDIGTWLLPRHYQKPLSVLSSSLYG
jgi:hypothetical protein